MVRHVLLLSLVAVQLSCVTTTRINVSEYDKRMLVSRLQHSKSFDQRATAGELLLEIDSETFTPVVGAQLVEEANSQDEGRIHVIRNLIDALGEYGTTEAIPFLENFLDSEAVVGYSGPGQTEDTGERISDLAFKAIFSIVRRNE